MEEVNSEKQEARIQRAGFNQKDEASGKDRNQSKDERKEELRKKDDKRQDREKN